MDELIAVVAIFTGIPLIIIGWVMSIVAARQFGMKWVVGIVLVFPIALMLLVLIHWGPSKKSLLVTIIGVVLILVAATFAPEQETVYYVPGQE